MDTMVLAGVVVVVPLTPVPEVTDMLYIKQSKYVGVLYLSWDNFKSFLNQK